MPMRNLDTIIKDFSYKERAFSLYSEKQHVQRTKAMRLEPVSALDLSRHLYLRYKEILCEMCPGIRTHTYDIRMIQLFG